MGMSIGKNTIQGKRLLEIIEQSEIYDADKKDISDLNSALMAAAKAEGFNPKIINILKRVPEVSETGAFAYGQQMFRDNRPITDNPFPFGDARRARCDEGWRKESGSDGMGDSED